MTTTEGELHDALKAIRIKLSRAENHLDDLEQQMDGYTTRSPYRLAGTRNGDSTVHVFNLQLLEQVPIVWSVILGEAVHDLRSALDQTIYHLALAQSEKAPKHSGFPICETSEAFEKTAPRMMKGIGSGAFDFIERMQPYHLSFGDDHPLAVLHELWNQDKHRFYQPWGLRFSGPENVGVQNAVGTHELDIKTDVALPDGAELIRVACSEPSPALRLTGHLVLYVAFNSPGEPEESTRASATFWSIYDHVAGIVSLLIGAVHHQDEPIVDP